MHLQSESETKRLRVWLRVYVGDQISPIKVKIKIKKEQLLYVLCFYIFLFSDQ